VEERFQIKKTYLAEDGSHPHQAKEGIMKKVMMVFALVLVAGVAYYAVEGNAQMGRGMMGPGTMGPGMMGGWGMGWLGMIFMMAFWILVIVGLVFLIKWLIQSTRGAKEVGHGTSRALEILKERYARGEITKEEFEQMKKDIFS